MNVQFSRHESEFNKLIKRIKKNSVLQASDIRFILTTLKWYEKRLKRLENKLKNKNSR